MCAFRMLVVDLDGTALCGHDHLRPEDAAAAARLKQAGIAVTIATGRLVGGTAWVAEALGVEGGFAVMNGSARFDLTGASHHHRAFDPESLVRLGSVLTEHDLAGVHFLSNRIHHAPDDARQHGYLSIWTPEVHPELLQAGWERDDVLAVGGVGRDRASVERARQLLAADERLEVVHFDTFAGEPFLSVRLAADDKGTALHALAAERGLTADQVVAVGDWWNDVPMLKQAGFAYAMGDASDDAVAAADAVLDAPRGRGGAIAEIAQRIWGL